MHARRAAGGGGRRRSKPAGPRVCEEAPAARAPRSITAGVGQTAGEVWASGCRGEGRGVRKRLCGRGGDVGGTDVGVRSALQEAPRRARGAAAARRRR